MLIYNIGGYMRFIVLQNIDPYGKSGEIRKIHWEQKEILPENYSLDEAFDEYKRKYLIESNYLGVVNKRDFWIEKEGDWELHCSNKLFSIDLEKSKVGDLKITYYAYNQKTKELVRASKDEIGCSGWDEAIGNAFNLKAYPSSENDPNEGKKIDKKTWKIID